MNSLDLEKKIKEKIRLGYSKDQIVRALYKEVDNQRLLEESVERICDSYPNYDLIQQFMNSKIITDKDGDSDFYWLYNPIDMEKDTIHSKRINQITSNKLYFDDRLYTCSFVYDPIEPFILRKQNKVWEFNTYDPPEWKKEYHYSGGKVPVEPLHTIPELYDRFLKHLTNDHEESYNYILDWLANGIKGRNHTILTTIGKQGIGKGRLGEVMKHLVGAENYVETGGRSVAKDFNAQFKNRVFSYLDEMKITTSAQYNRLKVLVNDYIEIEAKGKDAKLEKNFSSIYYSSNDLDSVRLPADDRRFSVVELTDTKLIDSFTKDEVDQITNPKNVNSFARYLFYREVDIYKMMRVFTSTRKDLVRSASLNEWQEWFMDEYLPEVRGKTIPYSEVKDAIADNCTTHKPPSRKTFSFFAELYSNDFILESPKIDGKTTWVVKFFEETE